MIKQMRFYRVFAFIAILSPTTMVLASGPTGTVDAVANDRGVANAGEEFSVSQPAEPVLVAHNVFDLQNAFHAHKVLLSGFKRVMAVADYKAMENIASNAVVIFPRDAVWRYNLACAQSRQGRIAEARTSLLAAALLGFSDVDGVAADTDLAILRRDPAFRRALTLIKSNRDHPEKVPSAAAPLPVRTNAPITVTNTIWNMEVGGFSALFEPRLAATLCASKTSAIPGRAGELVNLWLAEGTASGNVGDIYDNHDRAHSALDISFFTGMRSTQYSAEATAAGSDTGVSLFTFPGRIVIGNSSTANTVGPFWSSCARKAQADFLHILLQQYLSNVIYVYPQHHDYLQSKYGDVFPSRTPYLWISPGSSWTDRPILACLASALAALRPEVKDSLAERGQIAPVLQYLLRMSQTNVVERSDYLTPAAHPVVFDGNAVDTVRLVTLAHSLETNALPPVVPLRIVADDSTVFVPGRDYPDNRGERLFDSPFAFARVWRASPRTRKMTVAAISNDPSLRYHWFVGQGDSAKIAIRELDSQASSVEIEITYHEPHFATPFGIDSCRADVICVADNGMHFSPPSFITWYFPPNEKRTYSDDGESVEIDRESMREVYADPAVAK